MNFEMSSDWDLAKLTNEIVDVIEKSENDLSTSTVSLSYYFRSMRNQEINYDQRKS